tara:strand:- start:3591 stop:4805 length:1215 start_codon:yes stop_codon:yes gene_type:complete
VNKQNIIIKNFVKTDKLIEVTKKKLGKKFDSEISNIEKQVENSNSLFNILSKNYKFNFKISDIDKFKKFKSIAVVGMGGSILGSKAIYGFLKENIKKKIFFFDNLDIEKIRNFKKKKKIKKTLFIIISKSGNTTETLSNIFLFKILKKQSKKIIIISEKKNNLLYNVSKKLNLFYVEHKSFVGGRFSVLTEVGLIPALLMGININKLRFNLKKNLRKKNRLILKNSSITLANILNKRKKNNLIFINYAPQMENFLFWCQQLIAESLGKKGKGFLPVISNTPKDHHSLLQLYLEGPKDKVFQIFSIDEELKIKIDTKKFEKKHYLQNKTLEKVKNAQKNALKKTFLTNSIPFREIHIKRLNEETLGELFSYFILETILVGKLINVNPFNQPAVEEVKINTKKILS